MLEIMHFMNPEVLKSEKETVNKADLLRYEVTKQRKCFVSYNELIHVDSV